MSHLGWAIRVRDTGASMRSIFETLMQMEYDSWAANPPVRANTAGEVRFLKEALCLERHDAVLDLFCSLGRHVIPLCAEGYHVIGVDRSAALLAKARQAALEAGVDAEFLCSELSALPYDDAVDVIYSIQSSLFEAWRSPEEVLEMLSVVRRALKAGGRYLFGWPQDWCRADLAERKTRRVLAEQGIHDYDGKALPFYYYGLVEQTSLVGAAGFEVMRLFNQYDVTQPWEETRPGLVLLVRRSP